MSIEKKTKSRVSRGKVIAVAGAAALLIGASFGVQAIAESKTFRHAAFYVTSEASEAPTFKASWGGERRHRRHLRFETMSEAEIQKNVSRAVRHIAIEVDASPEQTEKITNLLVAVAKQMQPVPAGFRDAGKQMHDLLLVPTIDRAAIEKLRQERIAAADAASKEVTTALIEVAEILSVEQRKMLDERVEQFRSMRKRWHRN